MMIAISSNGANHSSSSASSTSNNNTSHGGLLLTTVKWAVENDLFLSDLVQRYSLPHLALVTKGQHLSVGAPNVANPNLKPYLLVHSRHRLRKVLAQVVKVKEGKGQTLTEHKLAIPETFRGYFEILSEDGRPVRCLETVQELYQVFPELCLVRQNCKCVVPDADGELRSLYRSRAILEGEVLTLVGQFNFKRVSFLRCFDEQGRSVYLKMSQKGKYSPIAKSKEAIAGVHTIQNLMTKRLPLTVKLVHQPHHAAAHYQNGGSTGGSGGGGFVSLPSEVSKLVNGNGGQLVVRLLSTFQEDVVFAFAVHKPDGQYLSVPLNAHLKLAPALNHPQVLTHHEFKELCSNCDDVLATFFDRITVCNDHQLVYDQQHNQHHSNLVDNGGVETGPSAVNGSKNDLESKTIGYGLADEDEERTEINGNVHSTTTKATTAAVAAALMCDDEIDQLYDYIRGLAPLPSTCEQQQQQPTPQPQSQQHGHHSRSKHNRSNNNNNKNYRPPPPPVETIPSRKSTNSFSSPEPPRIRQSPPESQRQRIRSPSSPSPPHAVLPHTATTRIRIPYGGGDTHERRPPSSPVPPEPRTKSPPAQFMVELRASKNGSSGSPSSTTRPVSTVFNGHGAPVVVSNGPPPSPDS